MNRDLGFWKSEDGTEVRKSASSEPMTRDQKDRSMHNSKEGIVRRAEAPRISRRSILVSAGIAAVTIPAVSFLGSAPASAALDVATIKRRAGLPATARVPPPAKGPTIPKSGYLVEEIEERVFWLTDGLYQMIFVVTGEGVVAVDAPPTIGNNILRAIKAVTDLPVSHAIYSHHHADHTGAMVLYEGAALYAQEEVAGLLKRDNDPNRPIPKNTFVASMKIKAGDDTVALGLSRAEPLARQYLCVLAVPTGPDARRHRVPWLGAICLPGRVARHPWLDRGTRSSIAVPVRNLCWGPLNSPRDP